MAQRMFPNQDAREPAPDVDRPGHEVHRRGTGAAPHRRHLRRLDDENIVPGPAMSVFHPFEQEIGGGRLFVHTRMDPYALVPSITKIIRGLSAEQVVEKAATLDDIRAEVLAPDRLNALVFGVFAGVARGHRGRRRCRRAGVLGERADAGVRHPAGDWIRAAPSARRASSAKGPRSPAPASPPESSAATRSRAWSEASSPTSAFPALVPIAAAAAVLAAAASWRRCCPPPARRAST